MANPSRPARPWAAFGLAAVAQLMIVLDTTIINVIVLAVGLVLAVALLPSLRGAHEVAELAVA